MNGRGGRRRSAGVDGGAAAAERRGFCSFAVVVVVPIEKAREQFLDPLTMQQNHEFSTILVQMIAGRCCRRVNSRWAAIWIEQDRCGKAKSGV